MALTIALCWMALLVLVQPGALAQNRLIAVAQWGRVSFIKLALEYLATLQDWPPICLPG